MSFRVRRIEEERRPPRVPWRLLVSGGFVALRTVMGLWERVRKQRERERRWHRLVTVIVAALIALGIGLFAFSLFLRVGALSLVTLVEKTGTPLAVDADGFTNILLMGQGNEDHDGIDLTDTIIVASIDAGGASRFGSALLERPDAEPLDAARGRLGGAEGRREAALPHSRKANDPSIVLLSLPRDLYFLHTEAMGPGKLNALWRDYRIVLHREQGKSVPEASILALEEVAKEVGNALNLDVQYAVKVDFTAFEEIVDALGGIDLTVPETIEDREFPGPNYTYQTFHIEAGEQHLDGATALKYARTRHTSSDFDRSKRQQQILQAIVEKAKTSGLLRKPRKIQELYGILSEHLHTNLKTREMITLAGLGTELSPERLVAMQLSDVNGLYDTELSPGGILYAPPRNLFEGVFVLLPVSIPEFPVTWKQVQALATLLFRHRELYLPRPSFSILNAGAEEGSARRVARELTKFGFPLANIANVPGKEDRARSAIIRMNMGAPREHAAFFASLFGLPEESLPADLRTAACGEKPQGPCLQETFGDVTILLGEDFSFRYFQNLLPAPSPQPPAPSPQS